MEQTKVEAFKHLYNNGNLTIDKLKTRVKQGLITADEFKLITGEIYK